MKAVFLYASKSWTITEDYRQAASFYQQRIINIHWLDKRITELEIIDQKPVLLRRKSNWLGRTMREVMRSLPNNHYSGHCRATEEEGDQRTPGKQIWRKKYGQQISGTTGRRWRQQHKTQKNGDEWCVVHSLGARSRVSPVSISCNLQRQQSLQ